MFAWRSQCYVIRTFLVLVWLLLTKIEHEELRHNGTTTYLTVCWNEIQWKVRQRYKCFRLNCGPTCSAADFASLAMEANFAHSCITYRSTHSCILRNPYLHIHSLEHIISAESNMYCHASTLFMGYNY